MKRVWIYGRGYFWSKFKEEVGNDYEIVGFLDSNYEGEYEGMICHRIDNFDAKMNDDYILIMISNINMIFEVIRNIIKVGIGVDKVLIGFFLYGDAKYGCIDAKCTDEGNIRMNLEGIEIEASCLGELVSAYTIIVHREYDFCLNNGKKSVVLDVGANIGDTALFFLENEDVEKVYSFEPFKETYMKAERNLARYIDSSRLELLNYGLSDVDEKRELTIYDDMSIMLSTNDENNKKILGVHSENIEEKRVWVEVKKASEVIEDVVNKYSKHFNIVLKMDCEGEEYVIMEDLHNSGLLKHIDLIMLEWHYSKVDTLTNPLKRNGFSYVLKKTGHTLGLLWAWNLKKD